MTGAVDALASLLCHFVMDRFPPEEPIEREFTFFESFYGRIFAPVLLYQTAKQKNRSVLFYRVWLWRCVVLTSFGVGNR